MREAFRHYHRWLSATLNDRASAHTYATIAVVSRDVAAAQWQLKLTRASQVLRDDAQRITVLVDAVLERCRLTSSCDECSLPRCEAKGYESTICQKVKCLGKTNGSNAPSMNSSML